VFLLLRRYWQRSSTTIDSAYLFYELIAHYTTTQPPCGGDVYDVTGNTQACNHAAAAVFNVKYYVTEMK